PPRPGSPLDYARARRGVAGAGSHRRDGRAGPTRPGPPGLGRPVPDRTAAPVTGLFLRLDGSRGRGGGRHSAGNREDAASNGPDQTAQGRGRPREGGGPVGQGESGMTCVDVRDRLTDHALGLLPVDESTDVERHLDWCAGCRKEASELQEAVATDGFSLPEAAPPRGLEERIVGRLVDGSGPRSGGRDHRLGGRGIRSLVAATLAAILVAMGAVGWAFAERHTAQTTEGNLQIARRLYKL